MTSNINRLFIQRLCKLLLLAAVLLPVTIVSAEVPLANRIYPAGTLIEYPNNGVSFILPPDTVGVASQKNPENEMLVGVNPFVKDGDNTLYVQIGTAKFATIVTELGQVVTFQGTKLYPAGKPTVLDGGIAYNDFSFQDQGKDFSSRFSALGQTP